MNELLNKALAGVDPDSPDAYWQILHNLLGLMPWWRLLALNVLWIVVGLVIAWRRGTSLPKAFGWALLLGPIGWLVIWRSTLPKTQCARCGQPLPQPRKRCAACGCARRVAVAASADHGKSL